MLFGENLDRKFRPWFAAVEVIIALSFLLMLIGRAMCFRTGVADNTVIDHEIVTSETVGDVLYDGENDLVYVCYAEGCYINAYHADGTFVWAAGAPAHILSAASFKLKNGEVLLTSDATYVYDALTGEFLRRSQEGMFDFKVENETPEGFTVLPYSVTSHINGNDVSIVEKSPLVCVGSLTFVFPGVFGGCVALAVIWLADLICKRKRTKGTVTTRSAVRLRNYMMITTFVHVAYTLANVIASLCGFYFLVLGVVPVVLHFAISAGILLGRVDKITAKNEKTILAMWRGLYFVSAVVAFFSLFFTIAVATPV